jgi:hypothetical protein
MLLPLPQMEKTKIRLQLTRMNSSGRTTKKTAPAIVVSI